MTKRKIAVLVLAAGAGTRMKSARAKVLHPLAGRAMIAHVLASAEGLKPDRIVAVVGRGMEEVAEAVRPHPVAVQHPKLGTAHAVLAAKKALAGSAGPGSAVLVLYGDTPLIRPATLKAMLAKLRGPSKPAVVVLGFRPADPGMKGVIRTAVTRRASSRV